MMKKLRETAFSISENMMVDLGQEVQYFEELPSFLEQGKVLTLSGSRYVLREFPAGRRVYAAVQGCPQSGSVILPGQVIAHAERYNCLKENGRSSRSWSGCGAYLQMNAGSLGGGSLFEQTGSLVQQGWY
ncbi:MAG: CpsB/CapC family capsule biosynthesis tyrosine phosphatase [Enterocloster sp.]